MKAIIAVALSLVTGYVILGLFSSIIPVLPWEPWGTLIGLILLPVLTLTGVGVTARLASGWRNTNWKVVAASMVIALLVMAFVALAAKSI